MTILAADAAAVGMALLVSGLNEDLAGSVGIGGYLFGGPIVHAVHGNGGRALASLAMRGGLPVLGFMLGAGASQGCSGEYCGLAGAVLGGMLGTATALTVDWLFLARRIRPGTSAQRPGLRVGQATILPDISVSPRGDARLGIMGQF